MVQNQPGYVRTLSYDPVKVWSRMRQSESTLSFCSNLTSVRFNVNIRTQIWQRVMVGQQILCTSVEPVWKHCLLVIGCLFLHSDWMMKLKGGSEVNTLTTLGTTVKSWIYINICVFLVYAFSFVFGKFPFSLESVYVRFSCSKDRLSSSQKELSNVLSQSCF